jgi:hypothetical protein
MTIHTYEDFKELSIIPLANLQPSDILIKKVFPGMANGLVERLITRAQEITQEDEEIKFYTENGKESAVYLNLGSSTSEHAALVIDNGNMAEAIGQGVVAASLQSRSHERYIVYRCLHEQETFKQEVVRIATAIAAGPRLTVQIPIPLPILFPIPLNIKVPVRGGYSLGGAMSSSFKNRYYQPRQTEDLLDEVIKFSKGERSWAPNMFCSEFVIICYEAAAKNLYKKTLLGSNPRGMSPMEMENVINYATNAGAFELVGRIENPIDIVVKAVRDGVEEYEKRLFSRPSQESRQALRLLKELLEYGHSDAIVYAAAHFTSMVPRVRYQNPGQIPPIGLPLKQDSTFLRILQTNLRKTGLFE